MLICVQKLLLYELKILICDQKTIFEHKILIFAPQNLSLYVPIKFKFVPTKYGLCTRNFNLC